jgi:lysozyme
MMQVTVFMARFMARLWCLVKGVRDGPAQPEHRSRETIATPHARGESAELGQRHASRRPHNSAGQEPKPVRGIRVKPLYAAIAAIAILAVAFASYLAYDRAMAPFAPPSLEDYPLQGIDVSHHQGSIDWKKLAAQANVRFVIMKATEGGDHRDTRFAENWQAAKEAGIVRGAYHFFTFCRPGREQAQNVLATVPAEAGTLPIAIDLEFTGNCGKVPTREELSAEIVSFFAELNGTYRGKPIFYLNQQFFDQYLKDNEASFPDHYLWLRSIAEEPDRGGCRQWSIWQFADNGALDGIEGPVDLNALCPSEAAFAHLFQTLAAEQAEDYSGSR